MKPAAAPTAISSASARRERGTSIRVSAEQVCPELIQQPNRPAGIAEARSASSNMMLADLPPSSSDTFFTFSAASCITRLPARVEPVNDTASTSGCDARASPTTGPTPVTRLNTPGGNPISSMMSASANALSGATSLGFNTTVQPAAMAGATFSTIWNSG